MKTIYLRTCVMLLLPLILFMTHSSGQTLSKNDREVGRIMLRNIKDAVKKNYYDPEFHGINIDEQFKAAEEKINEATSNGQVFGIIEKALFSLNDTHTFFLPPPRAMKISYDWKIQMIGDQCYILAVKPGTDPEAKGLKAGDILHVVDGYKITRENFWSFNYMYNALQPKQQLSVVVQGPGEQPRRVDYTATSSATKKVLDLTNSAEFYDYIRQLEDEDRVFEHRFKTFGHDLYIWSMPRFDMSIGHTNEIMDKMTNYKTLVIDLRGNSGGYVDTLLQVIGNLFEHDVKVGDRVKRKDKKSMTAKTRGHDIFKGQLLLLVDNGSASAAEVLSRVVQLEKRGMIIGDVTMGAVMESRHSRFALGESSLVVYGVSITDADLVMSDGKSLEHVGVIPDKRMVPTGADLRAGEDPVLSYAASLGGVALSPKEAGALFPMRWKLKP